MAITITQAAGLLPSVNSENGVGVTWTRVTVPPTSPGSLVYVSGDAWLAYARDGVVANGDPSLTTKKMFLHAHVYYPVPHGTPLDPFGGDDANIFYIAAQSGTINVYVQANA